MTAEDVRQDWLKQESTYAALANIAVPRLDEVCERAGTWRRISYRVKSIDSIVKKFIKARREQKELTLDSMTDKLGMRAVVRFSREADAVLEKVPELFNVKKIERKNERLELNQFGYQSIHVDVTLKTDDPRGNSFQQLLSEIQIRTLSQDLWSEMAHDLSYKSVLRLPEASQKVIDRRIYILSALVESADMDFSRIDDELHNAPGAPELLILSTLEKHFYRFTASDYDREFSIESIRFLKSFYDAKPPNQVAAEIEDFVSRHLSQLEYVFDRQRTNPDRSIFMFQPEIFLIFERLSNTPLALEDRWELEFPREELTRLQNVWGVPD